MLVFRIALRESELSPSLYLLNLPWQGTFFDSKSNNHGFFFLSRTHCFFIDIIFIYVLCSVENPLALMVPEAASDAFFFKLSFLCSTLFPPLLFFASSMIVMGKRWSGSMNGPKAMKKNMMEKSSLGVRWNSPTLGTMPLQFHHCRRKHCLCYTSPSLRLDHRLFFSI